MMLQFSYLIVSLPHLLPALQVASYTARTASEYMSPRPPFEPAVDVESQSEEDKFNLVQGNLNFNLSYEY